MTDFIKRMGNFAVCVVELEDCADTHYLRPARFACHVNNMQTGEHIGTVLTNARFEGCSIDLTDEDSLQEIVDCAIQLPNSVEVMVRNTYQIRLFNFGPIFPGTKGMAARKLQ